MAAPKEPPPPKWQIFVTIEPSKDGKWARLSLESRRPNSIDQHVNHAGSIDMLFERVQGEFNNMLRQQVNDIHLQVVTPNKRK